MRMRAAALVALVVASLAQAGEPFNLTYLGAEKAPRAILCVRPAELLAQPGMDAHAKQLRAQLAELMTTKGRTLPPGLSLSDVDQIVADVTLDVKASGEPGQRSLACGSQHLVVTLRKDVDWKTLLESLLGEVKVQQHGGHTVYAAEAPAFFPGTMYLYAPNARTLVLLTGGENGPRIPTAATRPAIHLGAGWKQIDCCPIALGFDNHDGHWTKLLMAEVKQVAGVASFIESAQNLCLGVEVEHGITGRLFVSGKDAAQAKACSAALSEICKLIGSTNGTGIGARLAAELIKSGTATCDGALLRVEGHAAMKLADLMTGLDASADVKSKE